MEFCYFSPQKWMMKKVLAKCTWTDGYDSDATVYHLTIYNKSEKENLTEKELDELLKYVPA